MVLKMEERFKSSLEEAPEWQIKRFEKTKKSLPEYELLNWKQKRYLLWLCGWDNETIDTFDEIFSIIRK